MGNQIRKCCVVLMIVACAVSASAQKYPIAKLTTSGSERFLAEDILRSTGLSENHSIEIPLTVVQAAAEKLNASGAFAEVKYTHTIAPGGMKVGFALVDKDDDQFIQCDFDNIVWLPEAELAAELHNRVPLFNGTVPRDGTLADDVSAALQALLKERGVTTNIVSSVQEPTNTGSSETVVFRAADMEVKVARLAVAGASLTLASELETESKRLVGLTYNRGSLNKFIDRNLRSVYLKHGYLRASFLPAVVEVISPSSANDATQTTVAISVPVTEGAPYKLVGVQWAGYKALPDEELQKTLHPMLGQTVDGVTLAKGENAVRTRYATMGYMHMLLSAQPTFDDVARTVSYKYTVKEGELFHMGKLEVEGLQPAAAAKVHLAWKLREGDPFDSSYVRKFFSQFHMPDNAAYVVEETEGERDKSVDLTIIFCKPNEQCRPKAENHLFSAQDAEQEIKP